MHTVRVKKGGWCVIPTSSSVVRGSERKIERKRVHILEVKKDVMCLWVTVRDPKIKYTQTSVFTVVDL